MFVVSAVVVVMAEAENLAVRAVVGAGLMGTVGTVSIGVV
jgi:hypothetical protein